MPLTLAVIGEENIMSCGDRAKITAYRSANDIDVQFENGFTKQHVSYDSFKKGKIANQKVI